MAWFPSTTPNRYPMPVTADGWRQRVGSVVRSPLRLSLLLVSSLVLQPVSVGPQSTVREPHSQQPVERRLRGLDAGRYLGRAFRAAKGLSFPFSFSSPLRKPAYRSQNQL